MGDSNITLGSDTYLQGWDTIAELTWKIVNGVTMPFHLGHGYFSNMPVVEVGWINGTVTDDSLVPLEGATVSANSVSNVTDASGSYSLEVSPGTYNVTATMTGYDSQTVMDVAVSDGETVIQDFALQLIVGWIDGNVIDAKEGFAIVGANVTADGVSDFTDDTGYYEIEVTPGVYTVNVSKPGYYSNSTSATVTGGITTPVDFTLQLIVGWINGTVTDDSGDEIGGASVTADGVSDFTDDTGYYKIEIVPGTYNLTASKSGYLDDVVFDVSVSDGGTETHNFTLEPIPVFGWING